MEQSRSFQGMDVVGEDNPGMGMAAAEKMIEKGFKEILKPYTPENPHQPSEIKSAVVMEHVAKAGIKVDVSYMGGLLIYETAFESAQEFMRGMEASEWPEAVYISSASIIALTDVRNRRLVKYVSNEYVAEDVGKMAAEQLIWRHANPDAEFRRVLVNPSLKEFDVPQDTSLHDSQCGAGFLSAN